MARPRAFAAAARLAPSKRACGQAGQRRSSPVLRGSQVRAAPLKEVRPVRAVELAAVQATPACRRTARGRCPPCRYCRSPSDRSGSRNQALSFPWTSAPRRARRVSLTAVAIVSILSPDVGGSTWWCCSAEAGRRRVGLRGGKRPGHTLANGDAKPEPSPDSSRRGPTGQPRAGLVGNATGRPGSGSLDTAGKSTRNERKRLRRESTPSTCQPPVPLRSRQPVAHDRLRVDTPPVSVSSRFGRPPVRGRVSM